MCFDRMVKRLDLWSSKRWCWLKATLWMLTCSYLASRMCALKKCLQMDHQGDHVQSWVQVVLVEKCNSCRKKILRHCKEECIPSIKQGYVHNLMWCCIYQEFSTKNDVVAKTCGVNNESRIFINNRIAVEFREPDFVQSHKCHGCCCAHKQKDP